MAKMVGLSRNLKLPWLNEVVRLYAEGLDDNQIKEKLNEYLSFEIGSPTVLRKTREILMNIWVYENDYTAAHILEHRISSKHHAPMHRQRIV